MLYASFFQKDAKANLQEAQNIYPGFRKTVNEWLDRLASEAEGRDYEISIDILAVIETVLARKPSSWRFSWRRWLSASFIDKIRAIGTVAKKRCPPWELRSALKHFTVVGAFDCEVTAHFEVDHVDKRIIFRQFDGLPGQD
jgi:hypothetical protein